MTKGEAYYSTGRRKTSVARTWLKSGAGRVIVNDKDINEYFGRETDKMLLRQPLQVTETEDKFDVFVNVSGGGLTGQAGAIRHGIARALILVDPEFRSILKKNGFLTRDPRVKERKKYGQRGARARFQYSKR